MNCRGELQFLELKFTQFFVQKYTYMALELNWPSAASADTHARSLVRGRVMCHLIEEHVRAVQRQYAYAAHVDSTYAGLPPDALAAGVTPTARIPAGYFAEPRAEGRVLFFAPDRGAEFDACVATAQGQLCLVLHPTSEAAPEICGTVIGPPEAVESAVECARQVLAAPPLAVLRRRNYTSDSRRICDIELSSGSYGRLRGAPGMLEGREVCGVGRHLSAADRILCYTLLSPAADTAVCFAYDEVVANDTCPGLIRCHLIGPTAIVDTALRWAQKKYQP